MVVMGGDQGQSTARQRARLAFLRALGPVVRRIPPSAPRRVDRLRVAVLRPDHLGDVLLSRPALVLLREALPEGAVTAIAGPWGAPSLQGLGVQGVTFPFPGFSRPPKRNLLAPYGALLAFAAELRRQGYDAALILRPDHWWGALACALAGVPIRVGRTVPEVAPFLTHGSPLGGPERVGEVAVRDAEALLHALEVPVPAQLPVAGYEPSVEARGRAAAWVAEHRRSPGPLVALHPGSGASIKLWPVHRWVSVVEALTGHGAVFVITAGREEAALGRAIQARAPGAPEVLADLSWDELAGLYERADLVIGPDSGPLHLAQAVGTATVRLYGPSDARLYGPGTGASPAQRVLQSTLACAPCGDFAAPPCGYRFDAPCLGAMTAAAVIEACLVCLAGSPVA